MVGFVEDIVINRSFAQFPIFIQWFNSPIPYMFVLMFRI